VSRELHPHADGCPASPGRAEPGECHCGRLQQPFGGEIWKQSRFPYMGCYIVTGDFGMGMSGDPREQGNTTGTTDDDGQPWTQRSLAMHLHSLDYVCCGQLRDILLDDESGEHFKEIAERGYEVRNNTRRWEGHTD